MDTGIIEQGSILEKKLSMLVEADCFAAVFNLEDAGKEAFPNIAKAAVQFGHAQKGKMRLAFVDRKESIEQFRSFREGILTGWGIGREYYEWVPSEETDEVFTWLLGGNVLFLFGSAGGQEKVVQLAKKLHLPCVIVEKDSETSFSPGVLKTSERSESMAAAMLLLAGRHYHEYFTGYRRKYSVREEEKCV